MPHYDSIAPVLRCQEIIDNIDIKKLYVHKLRLENKLGHSIHNHLPHSLRIRCDLTTLKLAPDSFIEKIPRGIRMA